MTDNTAVETTTESATRVMKKGPLKSFFDLFGGQTLRINNDLGAMGIFLFRSFFMIFRLKAIPDIIQQVYFIGDKYVAVDPGGGGDLLANGDTITDTNSPTDIMDLVSKYAFGDVGGGEEEE